MRDEGAHFTLNNYFYTIYDYEILLQSVTVLQFLSNHSPRGARARTGTGVDDNIDIVVGNKARVGCSIGFGDGLTTDPLGFIHYFACVRQAAHVPHVHQQVASCLEDVNGLVVGDDDETLAIHLQDLVTNLKHAQSEKD